MRRVRPAFFLLAALGTALGITAVTTVFSVAHATLPSSLPYRDPQALVVVWDQLLKLDLPRFPISTANYLDYRARQDIFQDLAAFQSTAPTLRLADRSDRTLALRATSSLLPLLGIQPAAGRGFLATEHNSSVVILTRTFWQSRFGSDPAALGSNVSIDGVPHRVIGILPESFQFRLTGESPDILLPLPLDTPADRTTGALNALGRLRSGVSLPAAQEALDALAGQMKTLHRTGMGPHGEDGGFRIWLTPLTTELYAPLRPSLKALSTAALLLLLLGMINTALLWIGRATVRSRDASIRLMLGATPARVGFDLAAETIPPTLFGGLLALGFSAAALRVLNAAQPPELAATGPITIHLATLMIVLALSALASLVFGLLPLRPLLRHPSVSPRTGFAHALLIGVQTAFVCALLVPSLLLVRSLAALQHVDPGFATEGILTASVTLPETRYRDAGQINRFFTDLEARLTEHYPQRAAITSRLPLGWPEGGDPFSIEGRAYGASGTVPQVVHRILVSRHYPEVLRLNRREGRGFEDRDFAGDVRNVLVNETLARAFFPGQSPIGHRILMGAPRPGAQWLTIAGVVADLHTARLDLAPIPQIFQPFWQSPARTMTVLAEGAKPAGLRKILADLDPDVPAYRLQLIQQHLSRATAAPRLRASIFSTYALTAFLLAAFGVYSLTAWSATRRLREFALRSALGATPSGLVRAILWRTLRPAAIGATAGLAASYVLVKVLAVNLFQVSPGDAAPYLGAGGVVLAMVALASIPAARRALTANPAQLLRTE